MTELPPVLENSSWNVQTGAGDVFVLVWFIAIATYVVGDTLSTWYMLENMDVYESFIVSAFIIHTFGYLAFGAVKLFIVVSLMALVHFLPDQVYTLNGLLDVNYEMFKDVYLPLAITIFGSYVTINNILLIS